jgi:hypothetical protein
VDVGGRGLGCVACRLLGKGVGQATCKQQAGGRGRGDAACRALVQDIHVAACALWVSRRGLDRASCLLLEQGLGMATCAQQVHRRGLGSGRCRVVVQGWGTATCVVVGTGEVDNGAACTVSLGWCGRDSTCSRCKTGDNTSKIKALSSTQTTTAVDHEIAGGMWVC